MLGVRTASLLLAWLLARQACPASHNQTQTQAERQPFSCQGRPSGYYADIPSDCQKYHQCDDGRLFTHSCPDMTRFQQRMMVCDHWYSVDCSTAEEDYDANLLLGQRHRHFIDHQPPHRATGRRRVPHRRVNATAPRAPPQDATAPAEGPVPKITFRYVEATTPSNLPRDGARQLVSTEDSRDTAPVPRKYPDAFLRSFTDGHREGDPVPVTTLAPVSSSVFLVPLLAGRTTATPAVLAPHSRDYVEVRISDPRLMFFIPDSGEHEDLDSGGNSTVVIHLDHQHAAMKFRSGGRVLPGGRNPQCPQCLPAFLHPGRCQPCVTVR